MRGEKERNLRLFLWRSGGLVVDLFFYKVLVVVVVRVVLRGSRALGTRVFAQNLGCRPPKEKLINPKEKEKGERRKKNLHGAFHGQSLLGFESHIDIEFVGQGKLARGAMEGRNRLGKRGDDAGWEFDGHGDLDVEGHALEGSLAKDEQDERKGTYAVTIPSHKRKRVEISIEGLGIGGLDEVLEESVETDERVGGGRRRKPLELPKRGALERGQREE